MTQGTASRYGCLGCGRKHILKARGMLLESVGGHVDHLMLAVGELGNGEDHLVLGGEAGLAGQARIIRKRVELLMDEVGMAAWGDDGERKVTAAVLGVNGGGGLVDELAALGVSVSGRIRAEVKGADERSEV